jgi:hypothetical protein
VQRVIADDERQSDNSAGEQRAQGEAGRQPRQRLMRLYTKRAGRSARHCFHALERS